MPHSPAPFTYDEVEAMLFDKDNKRVADLNPNELEDASDIPTEAEMLANGKLFTAAPDMLAALSDLIKCISDMRADENFNANTCDAGGVCFGDVTTDAIEAAREAIAKAEGRA